MIDSISVYAPATIANLGPGFDSIAVAIRGFGDLVTATKTNERSVRIKSVSGVNNLTSNPHKNTAGIAALQVLEKLQEKGISICGIDLDLEKGVPLQSGLGSSASSAVAAAVAVNALFDDTLQQNEIIHSCVFAEYIVSGFHYDNVIASYLGGFCLVEDFNFPSGIRLQTDLNPKFGIIKPNISYTTRQARSILPNSVEFDHYTNQVNKTSKLVAGICQSDNELFESALKDNFITPLRGTLIPGFNDICDIFDEHSVGYSLSGSGPSIFFIAKSDSQAEFVSNLATKIWDKLGIHSEFWFTDVDEKGVRVINQEKLLHRQSIQGGLL